MRFISGCSWARCRPSASRRTLPVRSTTPKRRMEPTNCTAGRCRPSFGSGTPHGEYSPRCRGAAPGPRASADESTPSGGELTACGGELTPSGGELTALPCTGGRWYVNTFQIRSMYLPGHKREINKQVND
eukprot:1179714-Prorocentrum_minimum.AAC.1